MTRDYTKMTISEARDYRKALYKMVNKPIPKSRPTIAEGWRYANITQFLVDHICEASVCEHQFVRLALEGVDDHPFEATIAKMNCPVFCQRTV